MKWKWLLWGFALGIAAAFVIGSAPAQAKGRIGTQLDPLGTYLPKIGMNYDLIHYYGFDGSVMVTPMPPSLPMKFMPPHDLPPEPSQFPGSYCGIKGVDGYLVNINGYPYGGWCFLPEGQSLDFPNISNDLSIEVWRAFKTVNDDGKEAFIVGCFRSTSIRSKEPCDTDVYPSRALQPACLNNLAKVTEENICKWVFEPRAITDYARKGYWLSYQLNDPTGTGIKCVYSRIDAYYWGAPFGNKYAAVNGYGGFIGENDSDFRDANSVSAQGIIVDKTHYREIVSDTVHYDFSYKVMLPKQPTTK